MSRSGRPKAKLTLTEDEREALERFARRVRTNRDLATRAKIILACAEDDASDLAVGEKLHISNKTVGKWRNRFIERRLEGLLDEPRPGAPRKFADDAVEKVVVQTLEAKPKGRTHWSTRSMGKAAGMSHATVGRIWRAFRLQPHIVKSFKLSNDPQFVEKVRDVVGLYVNPPEHAVVFAVDEKPQIQALQRAQPILPMDFGMPERQTHNYIRHGTLDLFAALDIATGKVIAKTKTKHRASDFVSFLRELDRNVDDGLDVHVILDNLSAHKAPEVQRWLVRHPHFHLHFTPTYSSWLNLVERFFGLLTEQALKRGSHTSIPELRKAIHDYVEVHNEECVPFKWTKTADEILESVKRAGERILKVHGKAQ
jgi:transposase